MEDSDLALPQTLPEIFEAAAAGRVSLGHRGAVVLSQFEGLSYPPGAQLSSGVPWLGGVGGRVLGLGEEVGGFPLPLKELILALGPGDTT